MLSSYSRAVSALVGSNLHFVAAQAHAAPTARTFLADIYKMDGASFAFPDAIGGYAGQQHHGVFGKRAEHVIRQPRLEA